MEDFLFLVPANSLEPFADEPFVGASVGYFTFLGVLAGRSLTVMPSALSTEYIQLHHELITSLVLSR